MGVGVVSRRAEAAGADPNPRRIRACSVFEPAAYLSLQRRGQAAKRQKNVAHGASRGDGKQSEKSPAGAKERIPGTAAATPTLRQSIPNRPARLPCNRHSTACRRKNLLPPRIC